MRADFGGIFIRGMVSFEGGNGGDLYIMFDIAVRL
jgi:hypothetical protein